MGLFRPILSLLAVAAIARTYFIPEPTGVTVIRSKYNKDVTISYKQTSICETSARSFAGYVSLPPNSLADLGIDNQTYPINLFFWFFEARHNPVNAPLSIWIDGGPGDATIADAINYNGPCTVLPDANSTASNQWSFNDYVNMLYIDQPNQAGFSYDTLRDVISDLYTLQDFPVDGTPRNATFQPATHSSGKRDHTTSTSQAGAYAMWHFAQAWFQEFPEYKGQSLSLSAFSYGGRYAPAIFDVFQQQNERIANGTWGTAGEQDILPLNALILQSGCVDFEDTFSSMPDYAAHNTYGIRGENGTLADQYDALTRENGCLDQLYICGNQTLQYDPQNIGFNATVNEICNLAQQYCQQYVQEPFERNVTGGDIAYPLGLVGSPAFSLAYLQRPHVQQDLGVRVNFTYFSRPISWATYYTGDLARPGWREKVGNLLDKGIKVAMMHGDRDYSCNWFGGETTSLNIPHKNQANFRAAGYEEIHTNETYIGGYVRQYGNLSFSRVFQAGHTGIRNQPETFYEIFNRAIFGLDIATGNIPAYQGGWAYSSHGPASVRNITNEVIPVDRLAVCYLYNLGSSCTAEQYWAVYQNTGTMKNFMLVDDNSTQLYPEVVGSGGQ